MFSPHFSKEAVSVVKQLVAHGYEAYIVGGAVRDFLLGHQPKDYDITTNATPEQVRALFTGRRAHIIGRRFRLCHVMAGANGLFEVSTFRREPSEVERRSRETDSNTMIWRDNQYGTLEDDVLRRDFTVNALYCDVAGYRKGRKNQIIDMCGGIEDARTKTVRTLGSPEVRFQEDPVRMLRALKLVGQHGFTLAPEVEEALRKQAPLMKLASQARMLEEIHKIFATGKGCSILAACHLYGLLQYFWPALDAVWDTPVGQEIQTLLNYRDFSQKVDLDYPDSHALAMATVSWPYLRNELKLDQAGFQRTKELSLACAQCFRDFLAPYKIPHALTLDVKDMLMNLAYVSSRDLTPDGMMAQLSRNSYPDLWELYRQLTMAQEWRVSAFLKLPMPNGEFVCYHPIPEVEE